MIYRFLTVAMLVAAVWAISPSALLGDGQPTSPAATGTPSNVPSSTGNCSSSSPAASSETSEAEEQEELPFEIGEKVTYTVTWSGIPAGTVVMELKSLVEINDHKAYRYVVTASSYAAFEKIANYRVQNQIESLIDTKTLLPYFFKKKLEQGDRKRDEHIAFDREKKIASYYKSKKDGSVKKKADTEIDENTQDPLSCFFYFRTLDLDNKSKFTIPVCTGNNNYDIHVKVLKKEIKRIRGVGSWMTYHIVPEYSFEGIFIHKGKVDIWVEEKTRIPVYMEFNLPIGFATVQIEKVEYPENEEEKTDSDKSNEEEDQR